MFSRVLIKLIDESIVPAIFLLVTRLVAVVLVAHYFGIPFEIGQGGFVFKSAQDYIMVNSYSAFFMIVVLTVGLLYILVKSLFFHETHVRPIISAKLFEVRLSALIQSSFNLYTQGSIWLSYCYLIMMVCGFMAIFGLLYPWVFLTSLILCGISTLLFVLDIEEEIRISKRKGPESDTSEEE